jgi:hypothetical protein
MQKQIYQLTAAILVLSFSLVSKAAPTWQPVLTLTGGGAFSSDVGQSTYFPANTSSLSYYDYNVLVYKVSQPNPKVTRYPTNQYLPHEINNSELTLITARLQLVTLLQNYLATQQGSVASFRPVIPTTVVNSEGVPVAGLVGSYCIFYGTNKV